MTARVIIFCAREGAPYRRHRWHWRDVYLDPENRVRNRWCDRCGQWWNDVIEHKA